METVERHVTLPADLAEAWALLTRPEDLAAWLGAEVDLDPTPGARGVVASLWQVDDESTAELLQRFYRAMLKDARRPADALRTAQLELARQPRWSAPFHWAGFVLQGDWR